MELTEALRRFMRRSAGSDVSLVFYAGQGIEMDGVNYLVPVDARLERDVDVRLRDGDPGRPAGVDHGCIVAAGDLDACRNNSLARSMQRTAATRSVTGGDFGGPERGAVGGRDAGAYAAAGTTAGGWDGAEQCLHSGVRAQVLEATNGDQRPHEHASVVHEHYPRGVTGPGTVTVSEGRVG